MSDRDCRWTSAHCGRVGSETHPILVHRPMSDRPERSWRAGRVSAPMDQLEPFTPGTLFGQSTPLVLVARGGPGILEVSSLAGFVETNARRVRLPGRGNRSRQGTLRASPSSTRRTIRGISQQMVCEFVGGPTDQRGKLGEERLRIFSCDIRLAPLRAFNDAKVPFCA